MTNPTPLIITNKFPSWIIQDKNQPPSLAGPAGASDRLGLIYFCFLAETTNYSSTFYPSTRHSHQPSSQTNGHGEGGIWDKRREWPLCCVICHVSSDLCHLRGPIIVSSWHHPDIIGPLTHIQCHQLTQGPGARCGKYFESDYEHILAPCPG